MLIRTIARSLANALRDFIRVVDQGPFVSLSDFADLLEEEVDDEPPQPGNRTLGTRPFRRLGTIHAT